MFDGMDGMDLMMKYKLLSLLRQISLHLINLILRSHDTSRFHLYVLLIFTLNAGHRRSPSQKPLSLRSEPGNEYVLSLEQFTRFVRILCHS